MGSSTRRSRLWDFMVRSVEEILKSEFGKSLSDEGVHILDPFTGTGNFITRIMQQIKTSKLKQKYANELHCNEVMLLPYYIASMNIEHAYMERTGEYASFEGICLVDTFDLAEPQTMQLGFMAEGNTERVLRQKNAPIRVVIGNPPYNMGQVNENDQNKNRKYRHLDKRIQETYTAASTATLRNKLSDPYVKAFRLASDRIRAGGGVIAFVTNSSFVDQIAFDGMRKYLAREFSNIYVIDLGGNVRQNPKLSGTTHNVFGIQVGVAITLLVRQPLGSEKKSGVISYARMGETLRRGQKTAQLDEWKSIRGPVTFALVEPDVKNTWLTKGQQDDYFGLLPLASKTQKRHEHVQCIFRSFSLGVATNRDEWVYNWSRPALKENVLRLMATYHSELGQYHSAKKEGRNYDISRDQNEIKWTDRLLESLYE